MRSEQTITAEKKAAPGTSQKESLNALTYLMSLMKDLVTVTRTHTLAAERIAVFYPTRVN